MGMPACHLDLPIPVVTVIACVLYRFVASCEQILRSWLSSGKVNVSSFQPMKRVSAFKYICMSLQLVLESLTTYRNRR